MEINPIFRKALDKAASAIEKAEEIALTVRFFCNYLQIKNSKIT